MYTLLRPPEQAAALTHDWQLLLHCRVAGDGGVAQHMGQDEEIQGGQHEDAGDVVTVLSLPGGTTALQVRGWLQRGPLSRTSTLLWLAMANMCTLLRRVFNWGRRHGSLGGQWGSVFTAFCWVAEKLLLIAGLPMYGDFIPKFTLHWYSTLRHWVSCHWHTE